MEQQQHSQPSLPGVPPSGVPHQALAYLEAVRRYYQPDISRPPRNADIASAHVPRLNARTWDRRKADLRDGKWGGRDWIEVWPPPRDWRPSWLNAAESPPNGAALPDRDGVVHVTFDEVYDRNGKLIERRLIRTLGHLGAVAALWSYALCIGPHLMPHLLRHARLS